MTVGTGVNPNSDEESYQRLAKGLYNSINKISPDYIVFFASEISMNTIDHVKELFEADDDVFIEGEDYEIAILNDIDSFNDCFETFERMVWKFNILSKDKHEIIMDYTSGTKTMSAAMACCGMFYSMDLISVTGDRKNGTVSLGTETIKYQNLYKVYDEILEKIVDESIHTEDLMNLSNAYYAWDNMDFDVAYDFLTKVDLNLLELKEIKDDIKINLKALGAIVRSQHENLKNCYILASLINNSIRRAEEYKYDDAIARLYRAFELIAQIRLASYGLTKKQGMKAK